MTTRSKSSPLNPLTAPLFLDEATVAVFVLGSKEASQWRALAIVLERHGLPKKHPIIGLRYWPAVKAWFDKEYGLGGSQILKPDGQDNPEAWHAKSKRRA
ncbi:hypothetical protein [Labrys sp. ZIDIC5]|uniref:hypothetical protein n=1 Tax=Labrys sedimenti TaxID=3106036 RepID=UPI002ACAA81B|nr:hypothetical protein [Labrys sp. ZIDIC5]MDZ5454440.1 hypothetical protein [Labrys sp. ZIDIC5]